MVERRVRPSRVWVFTNNNYPDDYDEHFSSLVDSGEAKGIVVGRETGDSGTPHLQGFVRWHQPRSFQWVCRKLTLSDEQQPHVEPAIAPAKAIEYCKKDGDFTVYGVPGSRQGQRTDLESALKELQEHRDLTEFKENYPHLWVKYPKGISTLLPSTPRVIGEKPYVVWLYGTTGCGKSRFVWDREGASMWAAHNTLQWFDGYNNHEAVLFDDFRGDWCKFHRLLVYLDRYPHQVAVKGGFVEWNPKRIYITSSKPPQEVYNVPDEDMQQLLRRIDIIHDMSDGSAPLLFSNT